MATKRAVKAKAESGAKRARAKPSPPSEKNVFRATIGEADVLLNSGDGSVVGKIPEGKSGAEAAEAISKTLVSQEAASAFARSQYTRQWKEARKK